MGPDFWELLTRLIHASKHLSALRRLEAATTTIVEDYKVALFA